VDIIKQLKSNEKPFGLMSKEMQEKAREIGKSDLKVFAHGGWAAADPTESHFNVQIAYRLRPDYEESGVAKCEVDDTVPGMSGKNLGVIWGSKSYKLSECVNDPNFIGFLYESGRMSPLPRLYSDETSAWFIHEKQDVEKYEVLTPTHVLFERNDNE
jgi:hypothetical protein